MNSLQVFQNSEFGEVRVISKGGEPWFVAKDVCDILDLGNPSQAVARLDSDERNTIILNEGIGNPEKTIVNEPGLYSLILGSRKAEARRFKRWITHEVIPSIRKHGAYMTPETIEKVLLNPDTIINLATQIKEEQQKRIEEQQKRIHAEKTIEQQAPKVLFADAMTSSESSILVNELAKVLKQNGISTGEKRLFKWLRENGYLCKSGENYNLPTQRAMDMGLFEIKQTTVSKPDGNIFVTRTPKVTRKGEFYFVNKFLSKERAKGGVNRAN